MGRLKSVARSSTVAWSPSTENASFLCAGTVAGAIDGSFDASASLELYGLDFTSTSDDMALLGSVQANDRFNRIAWGVAQDPVALPYGIIAGGGVDGSINIWNPAAIMRKVESDPLIAMLQPHQGPVRGLEFNPNVTNLLASGASNSEVYIIDVSKPEAPALFQPGQNNNQVLSDISCVAWNRKVPHILASTSHGGLSVVWDLKNKRPVLSFKDPNGQVSRNSVVAWNPEMATQLVVASEDDRFPVVQMWDLRNAFAPIKELGVQNGGHTKGVLSASWCPFDSGLLLTAGKDNRILCWNPESGEVLSELPQTANWAHDVQWSPSIPAILSACSFDGQVAVHSLQDSSAQCGSAGVMMGDFTVGAQAPAEPKTLKHAPKWLQRPAGATFGFGGQLATFGADPRIPAKTVKVHTIVSDPKLAASSARLQGTLESGQISEFCNAKVAEATCEKEKSVWSMMKVLCQQEPRRELLNFLDLGELPTPGAMQLPGMAAITEDEVASELFSQLDVSQGAAVPATVPVPAASAETDSFLKKALLHGSFEAAVEYCVQAGRMADALILAASGGTELYVKTRDAYLRKQSAPFMKVVTCIVHQKLDDLVAESELRLWKETLALLSTYGSDEETSTMCNALGTRLLVEAEDVLSATLCFMCGGNMQQCTELWLAEAPSTSTEVQNFMEKVMVLRNITKSDWSNALLQAQFTAYAQLLAAQGCSMAAMTYLCYVTESPEGDTTAAQLRFCLFNSKDGALFQGMTPLPFPFEYQDIGAFTPQQPAAPTPQAPVTAYSQPAAYDIAGNNGYGYDQQQPNNAYASQGYDQSSYYMPSQPAQPAPNTGYYQPQPAAVPQPQPAQNSYYQPQPAAVPQPEPVQQPMQSSYYQPTQPAQTSYYTPQQPVPQPEPAPYCSSDGGYGSAAPQTGGNSYSGNVYNPAAANTMPAAPEPQAPPEPAPAPKLTTAEASQVSEECKPIADTLENFLAHLLAIPGLPPADKRKLDDVKKRLGTMYAKMVNGDLSPKVLGSLHELIQSLGMGDYNGALQKHTAISTSDWADNGQWLMGLKRLIETANKFAPRQ